MNIDRRRAVAALAAAGLLWGTTVPLSKLALEWLPPGWLTFVRFGLAAAILLAVASGRAGGGRGACTPLAPASGAFGYGGAAFPPDRRPPTPPTLPPPPRTPPRRGAARPPPARR